MQILNKLWKFKASKKKPVIVWEILGQYQAYNVNNKLCLLHSNEKMQIPAYRGNSILNINSPGDD